MAVREISDYYMTTRQFILSYSFQDDVKNVNRRLQVESLMDNTAMYNGFFCFLSKMYWSREEDLINFTVWQLWPHYEPVFLTQGPCFRDFGRGIHGHHYHVSCVFPKCVYIICFFLNRPLHVLAYLEPPMRPREWQGKFQN